jgi:hypothetical protein
MFLSYLVENFFWSFKDQGFFCSSKMFLKNSIFRSIYRDFTGSPESSFSEAVLSDRRLNFWPVKIKRFSVSRFLL